ncbi:hypothetical protein SAMN04488057_105403 [Cyclobacterium lianum]|uniref:Uncharacterized protein n=1 Tax=Cyclobacterium lianum TaxID=388280 RepID=A0A1M7NKA2_9BACT|nr:hypothetical protein [Cyclobacterium lianum]SHN04289.1 hypothetical protein SAMN04488057_105403 [Cyclobacterium lianum]
MKYYVVKYSGPFGFIKPWTAVRDSETFSQQFLTPSIVEGIEKKLFPDLLSMPGIQKIVGHRLSYDQVSGQQEVIQTRGWNSIKKGREFLFDRPKAILMRGILQNPILHLAFTSKEDATIAAKQHICLCRNEDMLYPDNIIEVKKEIFEEGKNDFPGFELVFEKNEKSFLVGYHRISNKPMYGWIKVVGQPVSSF